MPQLTNMKISGVHLVSSPAIKKSYLIVKSENGSKEDMSEEAEKVEKAKKAAADAEDKKDGGADDDEEDANGKKKPAFLKSENADGSGAKTDEELTKALEAKTSAETSLKATNAALMKSALEMLKTAGGEDAKSAIEALESELGEKTVEKSTKTTADEVTNIVKGLMPDIVKSIEEPFKKANDEIRKELDDVKKSNALLVGERTQREIEELAKSLVGDNEKNIEYLRIMKSQLDEKAFEAFVQREQENAATIRKSSAFREVGGSGWQTSSGDSPYQQLVDIANGYIQKSGETKIEFNDAFAKATAERPELWDAYRNANYDNKVRED